MEKKKNKLQVIGKAFLKFTLGLAVFLFLLVNALVISLRYPSVQTWTVKKASAILSRTLQHQVTVGRVDIDFFKTVKLERVQVLDRQGEELFYVGEVDADIALFSIFRPDKLHLSTLTLKQPHARLVQYEGSDSLNISSFLSAIERLIQTDTTRPGTFDFSISELQIENGLFVYDNQNQPRTDFGVDYAHLHLADVYLKLSDIDLEGDTISGTIRDLRTVERNSGVPVHELDAKVTYAPTFWEFQDLNLRVADSRVGRYIRFEYSDFFDFTEFIDSVSVKAVFTPSVVYARDVAQFAPQLRELDEKVVISGKVEGRVKDFEAEDLNLRYGKYTHVVGDISMKGLPELKETFAELRLDSSTIDARDLKRFLPQEVYDFTERLGTVSLRGQFLGFYTDFVANGRFSTRLGNVVSDINVKLEDNKRKSSYKGFLRTDRFDLGRLLNQQKTIGAVSMSGRVEGSGFELNEMKADVDVEVKSIELLGYRYQNIVTDARFTNRVFDGKLRIQDPNLALQINGTINFKKGREAIDVQGQISKADLQALKLTDAPLSLSTNLNLDFEGIRPDELEGRARFTALKLAAGEKKMTADSLLLLSTIEGGQRNVKVFSDILNAELNGNFSYPELISDVATLYREYRLNFDTDKQKLHNYYSRKKEDNSQYKVNLDADLRQVNDLLHLYVPSLSLSSGSRLEASFTHGPNTILSANLQADTIWYNNTVLLGNEADLNASKLTNQPDILASAFFKSRRQKLSSDFKTENFYVEGVWNDNKIDFSGNIAQSNSANRANISGDLRFLQDHIRIAFEPSTINLLDRQWKFASGNSLILKGKEVEINNLVLSSEEQSLALSGFLSPSPDKQLHVTINDFNLASLNPLLSQKIHGKLNADLHGRDLYDQFIVNSAVEVEGFRLDSTLIGEVKGRTAWDNRRNLLEVDVNVLRDGQNAVAISGYYNPRGGAQQLNMTAVLDKAPLKLAEPFLTVIMHDLAGIVDGRIRITGVPGAPLLKGTAFVTDGSFNLTYLNTVYTFSDKVILGENEISFRNLKLHDAFGNTATVNGGVFHDGFSDFVIDMRAVFKKFLVLNTTRANNPLYYGSAVGTGNVSVLGAAENLKIDVNARSEKGTRIFIPLDNASDLVRQDFIRFVNRNNPDSTDVTVKVKEERVDLSGINLNFTLDVTDEAIVEIIFDERTGDIIRGAGNGRLQMNIDTRGDFNMYGQIEIARGSYTFSLFDLGLVTREFSVRPGGTITWNGDPYQGQLNVTATNTIYTSLSNLNQSTDPDLPETGGRFPVMVLINLKGDLLSPLITLGIDFLEYPPSYATWISAYQAELRTNEQELNNQVISLLVLRRLSQPNRLGSNLGGGTAGNAFGNSVGQLLSSQLAQFLSQVDNNLEIDISLGAIDQQTVDELRVRLSYSLLSGRLRVTRQGGLGATNTTNNNNATGTQSSAAGDWTVEYYLTKEGKYRLRLEYETSVSAFENANSTSTSFSILQTQRFDSFGELFRRKKVKRSIREQVPVESEKIILDSDIPIEL